MISPKNLIRIARKWQKVAALGRKRILLQRFNRGWMQTAVAHHQWLIRAILLFTVLIDDVLWFLWCILTMKFLESFSKCLRRSLEYKVMAPSYCHVIQSLWTMWSHSSNVVLEKIWRELWPCLWLPVTAHPLHTSIKSRTMSDYYYVSSEEIAFGFCNWSTQF